jgi:ABC-type proline/glycine betaine transport system permease subunit
VNVKNIFTSHIDKKNIFDIFVFDHIYQLLLHMVFTSRNWFDMQGPVAIILISWNVIFIWETGYWTRAMKRFAFSEVNVKNTLTSHIDKKIFLTFLLTSLSLYIFTVWKCIVYHRVIFIWETGYWTRAMKRFALFDLLKSVYSDTEILTKYIPSLQRQ